MFWAFQGDAAGQYPSGGLLHASDGYLYGISGIGTGGLNAQVFRIKPDGSSYSSVYQFAPGIIVTLSRKVWFRATAVNSTELSVLAHLHVASIQSFIQTVLSSVWIWDYRLRCRRSAISNPVPAQPVRRYSFAAIIFWELPPSASTVCHGQWECNYQGRLHGQLTRKCSHRHEDRSTSLIRDIQRITNLGRDLTSEE